MSWGNARSADHADTEAQSVPDVDHRIIFERVSAPCLVLLPDAPRFTVVAASEAYLAMARSSRAESLGKGLFDSASRRPYLLGENHFEALRASLEQALRTRVPSRLLLEGAGGDATAASEREPTAPLVQRPRWAIVNTPVISEEGELRWLLHRVELVGAGPHESGERERTRGLEKMLEVRTRDLENALAELDAFGYSVSHDLRAPLRAIGGFSQALSHDYASVLDERAQNYLDRVSAGAERMSALIDGMLELSRLQRAPLRRSKLDVSELARRILAGLSREHPARQVEVLVAPDLVVYADAHLMSIVLEKLLENAWKFTAKKPSARIAVGATPGEGVPGGSPPTLFVADDGVGFDVAYAGRLFSPFQRLHKASDFEGTGIGLAVAHRILSRHGGRIWAEAELGKGATFRFSLGAGAE